MSVFTDAELGYLTGGRQLGRIATVGADGTPHVVPVGWIYNAARDAIEIGGIELERSKKFRDIARTSRAAIVIDDLESTDPWRPAGDRGPRPSRGDPAAHSADPDPSRTDCQLGARSWPQRTHRHEPAVRRRLTSARIAPLLGHAWAAATVAARLDLLTAVVAPPRRAHPEHPVRPAGQRADHPLECHRPSGRGHRSATWARRVSVRAIVGGGCASLALLRAAPRPSTRAGYSVARPVRGRSVRSASVIGRVDATLTSGSRASSAHTKLERLTLRPSVLSRKRLVRTPWAWR